MIWHILGGLLVEFRFLSPIFVSWFFLSCFPRTEGQGLSANSWAGGYIDADENVSLAWCLFSFAFSFFRPGLKHRRWRTLRAGYRRRLCTDWTILCHLYAPNMRGYPVHPPTTRSPSGHEGYRHWIVNMFQNITWNSFPSAAGEHLVSDTSGKPDQVDRFRSGPSLRSFEKTTSSLRYAGIRGTRSGQFWPNRLWNRHVVCRDHRLRSVSFFPFS